MNPRYATASLTSKPLSPMLIALLLLFSPSIVAQIDYASCFDRLPDEIWPDSLRARNPYPSPSAPFNSAMPWITIVAMEGTTTNSIVTVESLELWRMGSPDTLLVDDIICESCSNKVWGYIMPLADYQTPGAWCYVGNGPECSGADINTAARVINGNIEITVRPGYIYHLWNIVDMGEGAVPRWRYPVNTSSYYLARATARLGGSAVMSIGFDYWIEPDIPENCVYIEEYGAESCFIQAAQTGWACPSASLQSFDTALVIFTNGFEN